MKKNDTAVCVVGDFKFLYKYLDLFVNQIRDNGKYTGEILVLTSIFCPTFIIPIKNKSNLTFIRFKRIKFDKFTDLTLKNINTKGEPNRHIHKKFQWHKVNLFHNRMKNWKYIFYIDINMQIHKDINPILNLKPEGVLFANRDSHDDLSWKLSGQFDKEHKGYKELSKNFDLDIKDYFQTGIIYYDTNIISNETSREILDLVKKYPHSRTNEQGILNLYFIFIRNIYKELPKKYGKYYTYNYWNENTETIITKQLVERYK